MWTSPQTAVGPVDRSLNRRTGNMAHRKQFLTLRVGMVLAVGLVLALLLTGRVLLLNQMTGMRANIAQLSDRKGFLETRKASLMERYNHQTSAEVVQARARRELGLVSPDSPGPVLVQVPGNEGKSRWALPGWLAQLAGGDAAQAGQPVTGWAEGQMVHLTPASSRKAGD